jgi:hypothetical protein
MTEKKKNKRILVKVQDLDEEELDKKLEAALDALLGREEGKDKPITKKPPTKPKKSGRK